MIQENVTRRIDSLGRISIPKSLRDRLKIQTNDEIEFYSMETNGVWYICMTKVGNNARYVAAAEVLEELGIEVPKELADMV